MVPSLRPVDIKQRSALRALPIVRSFQSHFLSVNRGKFAAKKKKKIKNSLRRKKKISVHWEPTPEVRVMLEGRSLDAALD